jgi:poly(3-hydroxyalkanoate) synthetase
MTDHLTPWKGCYRTTQLLSGPMTFALSNSGHIQSPQRLRPSSTPDYELERDCAHRFPDRPKKVKIEGFAPDGSLKVSVAGFAQHPAR